ncbi:hypothetical protein FHR75_003652 [Kineococcus radiotolerans]|uniref:ATPase involved in DNA repair n=1 Tax=Kineococcus radiotolerans TaxID=131568 RepID=A0A7W4TQW9_KINRA|nr:DUF349 domain-containing protein [Kineococcus radiotolerans]MBB2902816.1 hypothetical protein [Kineococcus radiotolerans]
MTEQPQEPASPVDVADTAQTPTEATPAQPEPAAEAPSEQQPEDQPQTPAQPEAGEPAQEPTEQEPAEQPVAEQPVAPEPAGQQPAEQSAQAAPAPTPRPAPAPRPVPRPAPAPTATPVAAEPAPEVGHLTSVDRAAAAAFGRVDENGTVWVRRADGEHEVGAYPDASPEEAIAYFVRKYEEVVAQVDLFDQRLRSTELAGKDIVAGVTALRTALAETRAVGDLDALAARVEALATVADEARAAADRARAAQREQLRAARLAIVEEAEQIAGQDPEKVQWRSSGERLRVLFEEWKAAQREGRLDKRSEDELWKRFSHARSAFDKMRRHHFAALGEQRTTIRSEKEALVAEAEQLSTSTDWRGTTNAYRALMDRWKAAGRLGRKDDDALWDRFRAAQDVFFAARTAANEEVDEEFRENLAVKEQLLVEAEALLPIKDLNAAKKALNGIQDRWEAAGKVPRADMGRVEGRLRAVETAVRDAEQARWSRSNPEAQARAGGLASQLENAIRDLEADVEKARASGDTRALSRAEEALRARRAWLDAAQAALRDA